MCGRGFPRASTAGGEYSSSALSNETVAAPCEHDAAQWGGKLGEAEVVVVVGVGVFKFF